MRGDVLAVFRQHPMLAGALAFDERAARVVLRRALPWDEASAGREWRDDDATLAAAWMQGAAGFSPSPASVHGVALAVARERSFDPFRVYLSGLEWDGVDRLSSWLSTYAGAEETPYTREVGPAWLVSAVARTYRPGAKVDTMLVLEGAPSALLAALAGDGFYGTIDGRPLRRQGSAVVVEWSGLASHPGPQRAAVKAHLSRQIDQHRGVRYPRRGVCAGTGPIHPDYRANRRFWCVDASGPADLDGIRRDRDQLWAEARARFQRGDPWWFDDARRP